MIPGAPRVDLATHSDRSTVLTLLAEHLPGTDVASRHLWLYERNPHGRAVTFLARDASGTPMGLTSLFPRRVLVEGQIRLGSIGGDGYVRPDFRRRGVATALHRASLELMTESARAGSGVEFMYGAPEPNNLVALTRAGSRAITRLRRWGRPASVQRLLAGVGGLSPGRRPRLVELSAPDALVADFWEKSAGTAAILPVRDPAQYAWRFDAPSGAQRAYAVIEGDRPLGVVGIERHATQVAVVDLLAPLADWPAVLRAVALAGGGETATLVINDGSPAVPSLPYAGFLPREAKEFQVLVPEDHPARATLLDPRRWHYLWADGDLDRILGPAAITSLDPEPSSRLRRTP